MTGYSWKAGSLSELIHSYERGRQRGGSAARLLQHVAAIPSGNAVAGLTVMPPACTADEAAAVTQ